MRMTQLAIFTLLAAFSVAGLADVYKWTDEKGMVHYTQEKPLKFKSVKVNAPPPPPANFGASGADAAKQIEKRAEERKSSKAASADPDADAKQKNCAIAKKNLETLQQNARVKIKNEKGEESVLSDEAKASRTAEAQKNVDFYCN